MTSKINILLADDHPLVRAGLNSILSEELDFNIVGEATDSKEVEYLCRRHQPDILLLDLNMPGAPAVQTVKHINVNHPNIKILILTAYDDEAYIRAMTMMEVDGYLLKDDAPDLVIKAIRSIVTGNSWFSDSILKKILFLHPTPQTPTAKLSHRDQDLLMLLTRGLDNLSIAKELDLSSQTVRNNLSELYAKIGVKSRIMATIWAIKHGFESDESQ